jgi:hypothetical protein
MTKPIAGRDSWHPQTLQDRDAILHELQKVVASPHFCNSKRYPALLQYIVENTLAGKTDHLKERTLGVEVFERTPTYDTNADTVVRYTAGEVRKRLLLYYSEHGHNSTIRISLPAGSYIPEFLHGHDHPENFGEDAVSSAAQNADFNGHGDSPNGTQEQGPTPPLFWPERTSRLALRAETGRDLPIGQTRSVVRRWIWIVVAVLAGLAIFAGLKWKYPSVRPQAAVDDFWTPVLREQRPILICTGSVVFAQNNFSGVVTAGKDIEYPFISIQIASAISEISGLLERSGATTQLLSSASTPLTELREHPIILLGGYNNQWTMRLLQPLRFQFTPEPVESIIDGIQPQVHWSRDKQLPYSSADDYALVARFRDATTGGWVVVLAGLGRNGTEAAAQFVASPHYMQLLQDQTGRDFSNRNIEAVLKVRVIDGKTGAPSILAVHVW